MLQTRCCSIRRRLVPCAADVPLWTVAVLFCVVLVPVTARVAKEVTFIVDNRQRDALEPSCPSEVYCHGDLLRTVQMSEIYPDSKTFVDMKMRKSPNETLDAFHEFMVGQNNAPSNAKLLEWVEANFEKPGAEFENWIPDDWAPRPKFLDRIQDVDLREFANQLHQIWHQLGRKMTTDVALNPDLYSIIHVDNPVIVPGGRFREFYYWDSYWIVKGLLLSEMYSTTKGMLENFLSIVQRFGFIPNGGRIYYSMRSQPPLLCGMVKAYVDATNDTKFAMDSVETLEREFQFFMNNYMTEVHNHQLATYGYKSSGPRPESYREDVKTAAIFERDEDKQDYYCELKAAAESGMDFSSRWFIKDGTNAGNLTDLKCRSIVAVELNAILYWNALIIAEFYGLRNDIHSADKRREYLDKAEELRKAINAVLWDEQEGAWFDYDLINKKPRKYFTPTNLSPLWVGCYDKGDTALPKRILAYIERLQLDRYPGGVPNTLQSTNEQWDFPNVWAPMQHMLVMGLDSLDSREAKELAFRWGQRWVRSNYIAYNKTHAMFEKYDAQELGGHGGGGEYDVQTGFGWTNGAAMDLMNKYGDRLTTADTEGSDTAQPGDNGNGALVAYSVNTGLIATIIAFFVGVFGIFGRFFGNR
ncbi:trehalase isoform X1 [Anopheles bellator]|uniref:trehalase isoform X1 n=2 Tax=Anopheles bellator TaxID=139047 RepID=UPI002649D7E3|nr:trehalase isoform X1 [Anopheles bellator]XP_058060867.1 trehalase isoform X1 [Anopheles bellator]